jgi:hypothetical protein
VNVSHPFGRAVEAEDFEGAFATLAPDVVFRSPAVYKPYEGRDVVAALLAVVGATFERFRYTKEWRDGDTTILFFEASIGDRDLQGIDILEHDTNGLIAGFTVMVRPLSGLQALAGAVAARLESR